MSKKDICPKCGINEKGIRAKTCRPCAVKALAAINRKAEENNDLLTKAASGTIDVAAKIEELHHEAGEPEPEPEPEPKLIGVDLAVPGSERTVIVETQGRPIQVGDTTDDGKFYK